MLSLFDPRSRMRRWAYALYHVLAWMGFMHFGAAVYLIDRKFQADTAPTGVGDSSALTLLAGLFVLSVLFSVRRLHDMGKTGAWALLSFVPVVNLFLVLVLMFAPGTPGPNRFGPDRRQTLGGSPATA